MKLLLRRTLVRHSFMRRHTCTLHLYSTKDY
jgi:hypothetical protein